MWMLVGARVVRQDLPERIVAESLVIVEIFVASGDAKDALCEQGGLGMDDESRVSGIGNDTVEGSDETEVVIGFAKHECTGIGGDVAAGKVGVNFAAAGIGKGKWWCATLCHCDGSWMVGDCCVVTLSSTRT